MNVNNSKYRIHLDNPLLLEAKNTNYYDINKGCICLKHMYYELFKYNILILKKMEYRRMSQGEVCFLIHGRTVLRADQGDKKITVLIVQFVSELLAENFFSGV